MRVRLSLVTAVLLLLAAPAARAEVRLPAIFGDHMVLQQGIKVPVWGWAAPGEGVTVAAAGQQVTAVADADGRWRATLAPLAVSATPLTVTVKGTNTLTLEDVLVGDVWVCSGQSNMEFGMGSANNAATEIPTADKPLLRLFLVTKKVASTAEVDCVGKWQVCTPETVKSFSAVGYFFGREIQASAQLPVGLIGTYWGGTPAQAWTSPAGLQSTPLLAELADAQRNAQVTIAKAQEQYDQVLLPAWKKAHATWEKALNTDPEKAQKEWEDAASRALLEGTPEPPKWQPAGPEPKMPAPPGGLGPGHPSSLFNGMIAPLLPYAIKGAIWYQGESNAGNFMQYRALFPAMITDWRQQWGQGDFPFFFVQLANFMGRKDVPSESNWAGLREAQTLTLALPNTGMAVIIDVGEARDIHPRDKQDVGHRLALAARRVAYQEQLVYSGPRFAKMTLQGSAIKVTFTEIGGGLVIGAPPPNYTAKEPAPPADKLVGFAIAGEDRQFAWADAVIEGDSVVLSSKDVPAPVAVRYGWADNPVVNLYNQEGLPASPFRTDDWTPPPPAPPPPPPPGR